MINPVVRLYTMSVVIKESVLGYVEVLLVLF